MTRRTFSPNEASVDNKTESVREWWQYKARVAGYIEERKKQ